MSACRNASDAASRRCGPRGARVNGNTSAWSDAFVCGYVRARSRIAASASACAPPRVAGAVSRPIIV